MTKWSQYCNRNCLYSARITLSLTSVESTKSSDQIHIPEEYKMFQDLFSTTKASGLQPHRPYDCNVDLLPGTMPPQGHICPLSHREQITMEEYVREALQQGYIELSTSPASAGFFFVEKKGVGLRPCIDYRGLNCVTVKYSYPLPLVPAALEQLRKAHVFTKLDLCSAYNLVYIL